MIGRASTAGFTLLELLVALAIFGFLAAVMYAGTNLVIEERAIIAERLDELKAVQRSVRLLQTDLSQIAPRAVRDDLGRGRVPALITDRLGGLKVRFSRMGWRNPSPESKPRGNLQRVQYRYDADTNTLFRDYWPVMERTLATEAREQAVLQGVLAFDIEFLEGDNWTEDWPSMGSGNSNTALPRAVRYRLELESYGVITRLVELAG